MNLTDKITTLDEYLTVCAHDGSWSIARDYKNRHGLIRPNGLGENRMFPELLTGVHIENRDYIPETMWWAHREMMRMVYGVYPAAPMILKQLAMVPSYAHLLPHVSKDDPELIAFTASVEDGMRDRQTRMALGRFLRKYYNFVSDKTIAGIEAQFRMEMNPPVEFIVAETHPKEFLAAYCAISSCMSKSRGSYEIGDTRMHPVETYCAPGFALAVLLNSSGNHSARSLVWINPEDPEDKRMVRTYGDVTLDGWLRNKGFVIKNFAPAYLKTKVIAQYNSTSSKIVVPYMDPGVINGNVQADPNGYGVWDGADKVYLVNSEMKKRIPQGYLCSVQSAAGATTAKPFPINRKCAITGETINAMTEKFVEVWIDGKQQIAKASAVEQHGWIHASRGTIALWHAPSTEVFKHGAVTYVKLPEVYQRLGWIQLDQTFYSDKPDWFSPDVSKHVQLSNRGSYILREDAMYYINASYSKLLIHHSQLDKKAERVAAIDDIKTFAHPDCTMVRTAANRKVVPSVHDVKMAYDGTWHYSRQLKQTTLLGETVWIPLSQTVSDIQLNDLLPAAKERVKMAVAMCAVHGNARKRALFTVFASRGDFLAPLENAADGKLNAGYIFEYTKIPMKLIEPWLRADYVEGHVLRAPDDKMRELHKFGRMVLALADEEWAKAHPKGVEKTPETAETA